MELKEKIAIVTGGLNGIGKAIVEMFLENGSKVVILDIADKASEDLENNQNVLFIKCDVTNPENIEKAITTIKEHFSKIDILINNAGTLLSEPLVNIMAKEKRHNLSTWKKVIDINLTAPFILAGFIAENMILHRTKGIIINISSISAKGNAGQSAYSASKAGLESMTKVWSKELGSFGIRSIAIAPGFIDTNSTQLALNDEKIEENKKKIPLKRLGTVQEISKTVKFLVENDYINGCILKIDGGLTI